MEPSNQNTHSITHLSSLYNCSFTNLYLIFSNTAKWWRVFGLKVPNVKKLAMQICNQTSTPSRCEHNWSTFSLLHIKSKKMLKIEKLQDLSLRTLNKQLRARNLERIDQPQNHDQRYCNEPIFLTWI